MRTNLWAWLLLVALASTTVPGAGASYGPESPDGFPINVDGEVVYPPVDPVFVPGVTSPYDANLAPLNKPAGVTVFPYYPLLVAELQRLADAHPDLVQLKSAGKSVAGLDLWYLEIADWYRLDEGDGVPLDEREVLYLDGGTHSNEYSGVYIVTEVAQFLLDEYEANETARWIVDHRHTVLLPLVNPDGSNLFGRINANTVNINRNYPVNWGGQFEDPVMNNPGPGPASEPETRHVIELMDTIGPDYANSIHCCGNMWLTPYGLEGKDPVDLAVYEAICDEAFNQTAEVRENCGPIWSVIYPVSGDQADTAYEYTGALTFGYEMSGRGALGLWGAPAVFDDVREQEREAWGGLMHALLNVHRYGAFPVVTDVAGTPDRLVLTVANDGLGQLVRGTVSMAGATTELPPLGPGASTTVALDGAFEPGTVALALDWQKRLMKAPNGTRTIHLDLASDGDALRSVALHDAALTPLGGAQADPGSAAGGPVGPAPGETIPVPAPLALLALLVVALARSRLYRGRDPPS